ncbi:hypothetical protein E4K10_45190 [Streptomyces sp. T1317-0309]|nr:hypothetical protein E4K10_45190 [Streptomyces sp. T1317-0309]
MTNLQRHLDDAQLAFVGAKDTDGTTLEVPPGWKTPQQGAATSVLLAASPLFAHVSGRYFEDLALLPFSMSPLPASPEWPSTHRPAPRPAPLHRDARHAPPAVEHIPVGRPPDLLLADYTPPLPTARGRR